MGISAASKDWKLNLGSCNQVHEKDKGELGPRSFFFFYYFFWKKKQTLNTKIIYLRPSVKEKNRNCIHASSDEHTVHTQLKVNGFQS